MHIQQKQSSNAVVRITVLRADGSVKADLGVVTVPDSWPAYYRIPVRVWIRVKYLWFRARRRI